jgi:hypothetical protein
MGRRRKELKQKRGSTPSEGFGVCDRWESLAWQLGAGGRREQKIKVERGAEEEAVWGRAGQ